MAGGRFPLGLHRVGHGLRGPVERPQPVRAQLHQLAHRLRVGRIGDPVKGGQKDTALDTGHVVEKTGHCLLYEPREAAGLGTRNEAAAVDAPGEGVVLVHGGPASAGDDGVVVVVF